MENLAIKVIVTTLPLLVVYFIIISVSCVRASSLENNTETEEQVEISYYDDGVTQSVEEDNKTDIIVDMMSALIKLQVAQIIATLLCAGAVAGMYIFKLKM